MPVTSANTGNWSDANSFCASFNGLGLSGWRMPTLPEMNALSSSLEMNGQGWTLLGTWSSTPYSAGLHYIVRLSDDNVGANPDTLLDLVSCVH